VHSFETAVVNRSPDPALLSSRRLARSRPSVTSSRDERRDLVFSCLLGARVMTPNDFCASLISTTANLFRSRDQQIFREPQRADETNAALTLRVSLIRLRSCRANPRSIFFSGGFGGLAHPEVRADYKRRTETECIYAGRNRCVQNGAPIIINTVWINSVYLLRQRIPPFYCPRYFADVQIPGMCYYLCT
jgi:hypothetical protein